MGRLWNPQPSEAFCGILSLQKPSVSSLHPCTQVLHGGLSVVPSSVIHKRVSRTDTP